MAPPNPPPSDGPWLRQAIDDHESALVRYASSLLGDRELARDVVQDTLLRLVRQPRHKVRRGVKTWLFTTCRRRALDVRKKEAKMHPLTDAHANTLPDPAPDAHDAADQHETHNRLRQRLATLPDKQREVLRLKFAQQMSYREIAKVTGLKPGYVGYLIHHGLKTLRDQLAPPAPEVPEAPEAPKTS